MNNIIVVAPLSSLSKRTRLFKLAKFLNSNGFSIKHVGWERIEREKEETELDFTIDKKIILNGGGYGGSKVKAMYFLWMFKVFLFSFTIKSKDTVWALGFESAFPLLFASKMKGYKVYFDDADRFSMLFNFPKVLTKIVQYLEKITSRNVCKHIIPVRERYDFSSKKFQVLQNNPSESEVKQGEEIYKSMQWLQKDIVININGWLGNGRGMIIALELANNLQEYDSIGFILAGKLDCDAAKELSKRKEVQYLGEVNNATALASYFASDFVFTYYDPKNPINRYAASNKWGDALMTGTGIIVNKEVETAQIFRNENCAISFNYDDVNSLTEKFRLLLNNRDEVNKIKNNIVDLSIKYSYFESQLKNILL